ncbi:DUF2625 domain-containing protein [Pinibacter aurantiacus]|uniref:DUF2625 domain-containing protein n=1 Tax=Pinibacter aurantiacus TaxID=2851599 RepID=A0A9E2S808_9BACT|nr:DUF2625 domain-containing protein [Pinibacter aurantiacus]MBV4357581.1 DUF2625 domain-containing protein [Pinibacter aurantiacus]
MTRHLITILLAIFTLTTTAQKKMCSIDELINKTDPGWPLVKEWIKSGKNKIEILSADTAKAKDALYKTQVTTRSPMGAIVYETGGLLIDNGWIRILGSGNEKLNRTLPDWNKGKSFKEFGEAPTFLLIADDAIGGFYMLNGGGLGKDLGKVYYFSPDNLEYEPLDITYTDFLRFCFEGDLEKFYEGMRWANWKEEVSKLDGNKVFSFYPYLWTKEGKDVNKNHRSAIPVEEQFSLNLSFRKQLGLDK